MSEQLENVTLNELTSSVEDSPVRTSQALARELALAVLEAACGTSTYGSCPKSDPNGLSLKTSHPVLGPGSMLCFKAWEDSDTRAYRSRLARSMSVLRTEETESLLLPTLILLPTLTASSYGTNKGGANPNGPVRPSLDSLVGGRKHLNPVWCEWFMGLPEGWTVPESKP
jgi:hypothetical protein